MMDPSSDEIRLRGQLRLRETTVEGHDDVEVDPGSGLSVSLDYAIRDHFGEGLRIGLAMVTYGEVEVVIRRVRDE